MKRREMLLLTGSAGLVACTGQTGVTPPSGIVPPAVEWVPGVGMARDKQEIYPALHGGEIWLTGGFYAANGEMIGATNETVIFSPLLNEWRLGPGIPNPRHHPHLQSHRGKLYAIGGFEVRAVDQQWVMQKGGWRLDEDGWNIIPEAPSFIGEAVTASMMSGLHVVSGRKPKAEANGTWADHVDTDHHFVFDGERWETAAPIPTARNSATAEVIEDMLHVVGGRTVGGGNSTAHEAYNPNLDRWSERAPLPQGQAGLASGVIDGQLYAFGGEYFENGGGVYPQTWIYNPKRDRWEDGPPMRTPRHGLGGVTLDNKIYAIGGATQRGGNGTTGIVEILG